MGNKTFDEWVQMGTKLFGPDREQWKFVCPVCGRSTAASEWVQAEAPLGSVAYSCIGRWVAGTGCNYAGGGFIRLNPMVVEYADGRVFDVFDFDRGQDIADVGGADGQEDERTPGAVCSGQARGNGDGGASEREQVQRPDV